jgi:spore coat polysaccharide biosynthesis protein SpsF
MDSTRFPGKVLVDLGGISLIELVFARLSRVPALGTIVLSTTARSCDDPLAEVFEAAGGAVFRCKPEKLKDVASRFVAAADFVGAEYALRVNGDSPFPIPALIVEGEKLLARSPDLVTNLIPRTYPYGVSIEWIRVGSLRTALQQLDARYREHFTQLFYNSDKSHEIMCLPPLEPSLANIHLTIDQPLDLIPIRNLVAQLGGCFAAAKAELPEILEAARACYSKKPQFYNSDS